MGPIRTKPSNEREAERGSMQRKHTHMCIHDSRWVLFPQPHESVQITSIRLYSCALWLPGPEFGDQRLMTLVDRLHTLEPQRRKLQCSFCDNLAGGAALQCCHGSCSISYHVPCARRHSIRFRLFRGPSPCFGAGQQFSSFLSLFAERISCF